MKNYETELCVFDHKFYLWELKENYKLPSKIKNDLNSKLKSYDAIVEINGSQDESGSYIIIYVTVDVSNEHFTGSIEEAIISTENSIHEIIDLLIFEKN